MKQKNDDAQAVEYDPMDDAEFINNNFSNEINEWRENDESSNYF